MELEDILGSRVPVEEPSNNSTRSRRGRLRDSGIVFFAMGKRLVEPWKTKDALILATEVWGS
jgi:hypothetical protein